MRRDVAPSAVRSLRGVRPSAVRHPRSKIALAVAAALSGAAGLHGLPAPAADATTDTTLEEVIVTARKRAENLQDVPISLMVFTSKDLQDQAISQFEDYATVSPSISFVSAGPGTQTFVMRGVSDGSNPNYSNTASTAFLLDDMSMNYYGTTPDLHLYDIAQIEVLNGPQGTTFGAGAMAGALRFITNKPDASAFSAGVDADLGKLESGAHNGTIEGFVNIPLIDGWTALRISAFDDYHGGYINNLNTTRHWVNGTVSDNSAWSGRNYNVEKVAGARVALGQKIADGWKASLTWSYQKQLTHGAWDQNPTIGGAVDNNGNLVNGPVRSLGSHNVDRFGPELKQYYAKTVDLHLDGDVGIGDLVYAGTYWAQDNRWVSEYSEYMQYINTGPPSNLTAASQQAYVCANDPINGDGFSGCNVPIQYFDNNSHIDRWSHELRLQSKDGGRFHWLAGVYWEKTRDKYGSSYVMPGLRTDSLPWQAYNAYYNTTFTPPRPDDWYSYVARSDYLQTTEFVNLGFDITPRLHVEAGTVHFRSTFNNQSYGGFWFLPEEPSADSGSSHKWNSKAGVSYKATDDVLVYANVAQGFRDGGINGGLPQNCVNNGVPAKYTPDTLTNYELGLKTTMLDKHLIWDSAVYYMPWKDLQTLIFDPGVCPSSSFNANVGDARIYGMETTVKYQTTSGLSAEFSASYNDSRISKNLISGITVVEPGERLPYVAYLNWSGNVRYEKPVWDALHGYAQFDAAHKGDMWNALGLSGSNGLPRLLQPAYSVMNLRLGLNQTAEHWNAELYITNLANKSAVVFTNEGNFDIRQTINEPRVFGVRLSYRFGKQAFNNED